VLANLTAFAACAQGGQRTTSKMTQAEELNKATKNQTRHAQIYLGRSPDRPLSVDLQKDLKLLPLCFKMDLEIGKGFQLIVSKGKLILKSGSLEDPMSSLS